MALEPNLLTGGGMPDAPPPPGDEGSYAGDIAKTVGAGVTDMTAQGVGLLADAGQPDSPARKTQGLLNEVTKALEERVSPKGKAALEAEMVPGEGKPSFWDQPGRATIMKVARMAPQLGALALLPEGGAGVLMGAAVGGAQGVAQQLNDTRKATDAMSDDQLQERSTAYKKLRAGGMEEREAREKLIGLQNDALSLAFAGGGGALGMVGPAAALKTGTHGLLKGAAVGAAEGFGGGAAMGAGSATGRQVGEKNAGMRDTLDSSEIALSALNSGLEMGALGGTIGGARGAFRRRATAPEETRGELAPDPAQEAALKGKNEAPPEAPAETPPAAEPPPAPPPGAVEGPLDKAIREHQEALAEGKAPPQVAIEPEPERPAAPPPQIQPEPPPPGMRNPETGEETPLFGVKVREPAGQPTPLTTAEVAAALEGVPRKKSVQAAPSPEPTAELTGAPKPGLEPNLAPPMRATVVAEAPASAAPSVVAPPAVVPKKGTLTLKKITSEGKTEGKAETAPEAPAKPRVFAAPVTPEVAALKVAKKVADKIEANKAKDRERKQTERLAENQRLEERAKKLVEESHPSDEERPSYEAVEARAMDKSAGEPAYDALYARAKKVLLTAEDEGLSIPDKTTWSKKLPDERNPTPHLSRLTEIKKFAGLYEKWKAAPAAARSKSRFAELVAEHVRAEKAIREGKLDVAAERRLEKNAEYNQRFRESGEHDETLSVYETPTDSRGHAVDRKETVRDVLTRTKDQLYGDFNAPAHRDAQNELLHEVVDRVIHVAGDTPVYHVTNMPSHLGRDANAASGNFTYETGGKRAGGTRGEIYLKHDLSDEGHVRVPLHEAVHAATAHAITQNPKFRRQIRSIMSWALHRTKDQARDIHVDYALSGEYGFANEHEFVAEALANRKFQERLRQIEVPRPIAEAWGLPTGEKPTVWQSLVAAIGRALGLSARAHNVLDAILHKSSDLLNYEVPQASEGIVRSHAAIPTRAQAQRVLEDHVGTPSTWRTKLRSFGHKLATNDQLGQAADHLFGADTPARRLTQLVERMGVEKDKIINGGDHQLVAELAGLERKYTTSGMWSKFADFLHDETVSGAWADRSVDYLGKDRMATWQAVAQHVGLAAKHDALPADLQGMRIRLHEYFAQRQKDMAIPRLRNIIKVANGGVANDGLADRFFHGTMTDAEKGAVKGDAALKEIKATKMLAKITGPYVPLMRRGEFVVHGKYKLTSPGNAVRLDGDGKQDPTGNIFEFKTRDEARKFVEAQEHKVVGVRKVYTDPKTGERFGIDEDGEQHKLTKEDFGWGQANERYRVTVQDKHVEFHDSEVKARRAHELLSAHPGMEVAGLQIRRWEPGGHNASFMHEQMDKVLNSLQQRKGFKDLTKEQQAELVNQLRDASISVLGSTRAQSHRLPRTNVAGASHDITTNTAQYASSSAGYLARLRHAPALDATMKELSDFDQQHQYEKSERTLPRSQLLRELKQRAYGNEENTPSGFWHGAGNRLLQLSYLDKLASPAFHVINSSEPWTVSMPVIAGRHGIGKTISALSKAYRDIGAGSAAMKGLTDTGKAFKADTGLTDYTKRFIDRLKKQPDGKHVGAMLEHLFDTGLLSRDAGMELQRISNPQGSVIGRGLDRADLMARQMGTAVESINRAVTGIAAYRLEFDKTKNHDKAVAYAREKVNDTMGNYSRTNAAPIFNHPIGRIALQFKKYAQKTYYLLGKTASQALRGDPEAMKQFAGLMATHMAVAGFLGLPTEAIKAAMLAANLAGITTSNYGDYEQWVRQTAGKVLGPVGGQIFARGAPRYLGVDLSSRMGLEQLILPMQDLKSTKQDDLYAYAAKAFAGAPASMLVDWVNGMQALQKGDFAEFARLTIPVKLFADAIQAAQKTDHGKKTAAGRESLTPYSAGEAFTRTLGFTPGREAEMSEFRGAMQGDQQRQRTDKSTLQSRWLQAATPAEKSAIWSKIQVWNQDKPNEAKLSMQQLVQAQQRRGKEKGADFNDGIRTTKGDRHLREQSQFYNLQR